MSKEEQFEHIENKIKQAIMDEQPAFDEKAWLKMEILLDKEEKKRRPFFWLWFLVPLLLLGSGGAYYLYNKNLNTNYPENIVQTTNEKSNVPASQNLISTEGETVAKTITGSIKQEEALPSLKKSALVTGKRTEGDNELLKGDGLLNKQAAGKNEKSSSAKQKNAAGRYGSAGNNLSNNNRQKAIISDNAKAKIKTSDNEPEDAALKEQKASDKNVTVNADTDHSVDTTLSGSLNKKQPNTGIAAAATQSKPKRPGKKSRGFYFLASVGADIGSVKLFPFNNSSLAVRYGIGIGYQLNNKWGFQTGFYAGKKKYIAGPNDYHTKRVLPNYVKINKVNADCMIYEIPITVRYDIFKKSSIAYYTTIGLSSYLMKKEDYNFHTTVNNIPREFDTTYTGNKHLFSNLTISAGLEKKVSKSLSIQLEPSVSLPLSGVGYGKVKLFSTAIMIGVKYIPLKKIMIKNKIK
jgi:hypothetical protein